MFQYCLQTLLLVNILYFTWWGEICKDCNTEIQKKCQVSIVCNRKMIRIQFHGVYTLALGGKWAKSTLKLAYQMRMLFTIDDIWDKSGWCFFWCCFFCPAQQTKQKWRGKKNSIRCSRMCVGSKNASHL